MDARSLRAYGRKIWPELCIAFLRKRLVIVQHWYLDLPQREIAEVTGLSEHAVESRLRRGVEELR